MDCKFCQETMTLEDSDFCCDNCGATYAALIDAWTDPVVPKTCPHDGCSNYEDCHSDNPDLTQGCEVSTPKMQTCTFMLASELGLSEEGWESIYNNSNLTFGDANRTLYTFDRLLMHVDFDNPEDTAKIEAAKEAYGYETEYVDLEN